MTVRLHGGHTPAEHDGYPTEMILPAAGFTPAEHTRHGGWSFAEGSKEYVYPLEQQAATLWYHDHRMDFSGPQVYRGLAGFHIIRDDADDALPLPKEDKDIPLMITDRAFAEDGSFAYPSLDPSLTGRPGVAEDYMEGVLGDVILVNGPPWPVLEVTCSRHRFRILNASNARRYQLALDPPPADGPAFVQVGSDGGLLATPQPHDELPVAAAERYDVVVDFAAYRPGTEATLVNRFATGPPSEVMRFRVTRREADSTVPATPRRGRAAAAATGRRGPRRQVPEGDSQRDARPR